MSGDDDYDIALERAEINRLLDVLEEWKHLYKAERELTEEYKKLFKASLGETEP